MSQATRELDAVVDVRDRPHLDVRVYDDFSEIPGQQETWNKLVDESAYPNVFLRWEWVTSWWKWFGAGRQPYLIVVVDGSEIVGIAPLHIARARFGFPFRPRKLAFIGAGGPTCPEYLGPIVHRNHMEHVIGEIARHLQSSSVTWTAVEFPDVAPDDSGTNLLLGQLRNAHPTLSWPGEVCPYLDLPASYDLLLGRLSSHSRQRRKRQLRRAREECEVQLDLMDMAHSAPRAFATMVSLSSSSRRRAGEISPFLNPAYAGFHQEVIARLTSESIARIYVLSFHGAPVGFLYGFSFHHKYYAFQTGFDAGLARYSPGDVLYQMVFQHLIGGGATEFDYLRGDESYKSFFANAERRTETTFVYRRRGFLYFRQLIRTRAYSRLRGWLKGNLAVVEKNKKSRTGK